MYFEKVYSDGDHPREYGENHVAYPADHPNTGSSPRIRGKCIDQLTKANLDGIIPANTGKIR